MGTYVVVMISSLVLLISRIGPWYLKDDELLLSSFTEQKQKYIFTLSSLLTPFHSLEKLLSVIQVHVLSHCVLYQWFWTKRNKNKDARLIEIKCSDEQKPRSSALTPTFRHNFEGQRQEVIKGGVQHYGLDLWVGHCCPRSWERENKRKMETSYQWK